MLARLQDVLRQAQRRRYAVGAFNISNLELAQAVIQSAAELRAPVIVNTSPSAIEYAGLKPLSAIVTTLAAAVKVPVVLNLDHGKDVSLVRDCIGAGYTGIMFDGSRLPTTKNVALTKKSVSIAARRRIGVEGEIGQVKNIEDAKKKNAGQRYVMTDPEEARWFVARTKVVAFAVAIGNAHGLPMPDEKLDFQRLAAIRRRVTVPLVLHGASGTPPKDIRRAITLGISKINIDTDLRLAFTQALRTTLGRDPKLFDPRAELDAARNAVASIVKEKIILFGSRHKA